jgi:hypothetical protein
VFSRIRSWIVTLLQYWITSIQVEGRSLHVGGIRPYYTAQFNLFEHIGIVSSLRQTGMSAFPGCKADLSPVLWDWSVLQHALAYKNPQTFNCLLQRKVQEPLSRHLALLINAFMIKKPNGLPRKKTRVLTWNIQHKYAACTVSNQQFLEKISSTKYQTEQTRKTKPAEIRAEPLSHEADPQSWDEEWTININNAPQCQK